MESFPYADRKQFFMQKREDFKRNPESLVDLEAYARRDNTHNYTVLKGFIPPALIDKKTPGGLDHWKKSDTVFSDFQQNHPDQVLSESGQSLVIGNVASHDTRQYLAKWDLDGKDQRTAAGMSYMHLLVIPKERIYNAVVLDDTLVIEEMIAHFHRFWNGPESIDKITGWLKAAVERRAKVVREALTSHAPDLVDEFDATMKVVRASGEEFENELRLCQKSEDDQLLFFGFHPAPEASVAHLHMHVILVPSEFREFSTGSHDWKTVPAQAVIEVIGEEARRHRKKDVKV